MPAIVTDTGSDFKKLPPGTYPAVCDMVVMLGRQETTYGVKQQVYLRWEVPAERVEYEKDGVKHNRPMAIGATLTASLNEKATLGQWIQNWRGVPFTKEELKGFDLFRLLGAPCLISVTHNTSGGKTYANVASVARLVKGMEAPKAEMPLLRYSADETGDYDQLPEWIHKKLDTQVPAEASQASHDHASTEDSTIMDDDIPF